MTARHERVARRAATLMGLLSLVPALIGCGGGNGTEPGPPAGDIIVNVEPDSIAVTWLLVGPDSFQFHGSGDDTLSRVQPGAYTITWPDLPGRVTPAPNPQSKLLGDGGSILFAGSYPGIGTVTVDVTPDNLPAYWTLDGPGGYREERSGDYSVSGMAEGDYTITWGQQTGYRTPAPISGTQPLGGGGAITFSGEYVAIATLVVNTEPDAIHAPWSVTGPAGFFASGEGDSTFVDVVAGSYSVRFLHKSGWLDPAPDITSIVLAPGDRQTVLGTYAQAASLSLEPEPYGIRAPWSVSGPAGFANSGSGSSTLADIPPGQYAVTWLAHGGWESPPSAPQEFQLSAGSHAVSGWRYEWTSFTALPGNTYSMGSPPSETDRQADEQQHQVTLTQPFVISPVEVTQDQWLLFMGANPSTYDCGSCPVHNVSWHDAIAFCNRLSDEFGYERAYRESGDSILWDRAANGFRLPTEAEWEYACRAGTTTAFSGAGMWYGAGSGGHVHAVGTKAWNSWGLLDMHGNAAEWCWDWYGIYYSLPATDPTGASTGTEKIYRGGHWASASSDCRSARRQKANPAIPVLEAGLRLVRNAN